MTTVKCEVEPSYAATMGGGEKPFSGGKVDIPHQQRRLVFPVAGNGRRGGGGASNVAIRPYGNSLLPRRSRTSAGNGMQVFVRTPARKTLTIAVDPSDTVDAVKAKIHARERVGGEQHWRLVFAGRQLRDGRRTLADYGVGNGANLHLLLHLRGGGGTGDNGVDVVGPHWATTIGLRATMVATAAALSCLFPAAASSGGPGAALVFFLFAVAVAGVNLMTVGLLCLSSTAAATTTTTTGICLFGATGSVGSRTTSFVCRSVAVVGPHWATTIGLRTTVVAVAVALSCFFPAAAGSRGPGAALVFFLFVVTVAGVNSMTVGLLCLGSTTAATTTTTGIRLAGATRSVVSKTTSFVRRNVAVVAVSGASFAVAGVVVSAPRPVLCFGFFALFLVDVSLITIRSIGSAN